MLPGRVRPACAVDHQAPVAHPFQPIGPLLVPAEGLLVAHYNNAGAGAGESNVQALPVTQKANPLLGIAANGTDHHQLCRVCENGTTI
jgi:hypothetical protein